MDCDFSNIMWITVDLLIFVFGVAIFAVGMWVTLASGFLMGLVGNVGNIPFGLSQVLSVTELFMALGVMSMLVAILGFLAIIKENSTMILRLFFGTVLIIFLIELASAVVLFVFEDLTDQLFNTILNGVRENIQMGYGKPESLTTLWNDVMEEFQCCGFTNYTDFDGSPFYTSHGGNSYPPTCCMSTIAVNICSKEAAKISLIQGCLGTLLQLIQDNAVNTAAMAITAAILKIPVMVLAFQRMYSK